MPSFKHFKEEKKLNFLDRESLEGFIYTNVFSPSFLKTLKNFIDSTLEHSDKKTFLTHNTKFSFENKTIKIISHKQNGREQNVIYDLTFDKDFYFQTKETVKQYFLNYKLQHVSPVFIKVLQELENLPPFNDEKDKWLPYRLHINYLAKDKLLTTHIDSSPYIVDSSKQYQKDNSHARMQSVTFYLYDHIENEGGEFFTPNGFVYKPKENTAISINGNRAFHGVTQNKSDIPRRAFTVRLIHIDDMYLPGHPDKFLYKVSDFYD